MKLLSKVAFLPQQDRLPDALTYIFFLRTHEISKPVWAHLVDQLIHSLLMCFLKIALLPAMLSNNLL